MTAQAILLVVSCNLLVGGIRLVQRPAPSIAPQGIAGIASFFVFHHDEPYLCPLGPMHIAGRHLTVLASENFFDQDGSICKLSILAVVLSRARHCVRVVHLGVATLGSHRKSSQNLILIPVIGRLANDPVLIDQIESVMATRATVVL